MSGEAIIAAQARRIKELEKELAQTHACDSIMPLAWRIADGFKKQRDNQFVFRGTRKLIEDFVWELNFLDPDRKTGQESCTITIVPERSGLPAKGAAQ